MTRKEVDLILQELDDVAAQITGIRQGLKRIRQALPEDLLQPRVDRLELAWMPDGRLVVRALRGSVVLPSVLAHTLVALTLRPKTQVTGLIPFKTRGQIETALARIGKKERQRPLKHGALRTRIQRLRSELREIGLADLIENDRQGCYRIALRPDAIRWRTNPAMSAGIDGRDARLASAHCHPSDAN